MDSLHFLFTQSAYFTDQKNQLSYKSLCTQNVMSGKSDILELPRARKDTGSHGGIGRGISFAVE